MPIAQALDTMRGQGGQYDPQILEMFSNLRRANWKAFRWSVHEVPLRSVGLGMTFAEDFRTHAGSLLIARGQEVSLSLLERIRHLPASLLTQPVRVIVKEVPKAKQPSVE